VVGRTRAGGAHGIDALAGIAACALCTCFLSVLAALPVFAADESVLLSGPASTTVEEDAGSLDRAFEEKPRLDTPLSRRIRRSMQNLPAFFRDTELDVDFRNYYFRRRTTDNLDSEAWAIGGGVLYRSGWLLDAVQLGASMFTSQKLYGPSDRDGTGLLRPRQRSYIVLGESFLRLRAKGSQLTVYRQQLDLPYVNGNDSRMSPNTFEGVSLLGRYEKVGYAAGHLLQFRRRASKEFVSFSEAAGVPGASSNGLTFAGLRVKPSENLSVGAINAFVKDTLNIAYVELEWLRKLPNGAALRLGGQFTHQRSAGDDRLTGESFETWVAGGKIAASWRKAVFSIAVSSTDHEASILNPWGSYPGYLGMMQRNFNDANEIAWGATLSWHFDRIGAPDLSMALRYSEGYDGRDTRTDENLGDHRELNATLDYRISSGIARGLWLRGRFAWGQIENARRDSFEGRAVIRYEFQIL
jgi:outer membrane porin, OprD family